MRLSAQPFDRVIETVDPLVQVRVLARRQRSNSPANRTVEDSVESS